MARETAVVRVRPVSVGMGNPGAASVLVVALGEAAGVCSGCRGGCSFGAAVGGRIGSRFGFRGGDRFGVAYKNAYAGAVDSGGAGGGGLGEYDSWWPGRGDVCDDTELQREAAEVMVAGRSGWPMRLGMETCWAPRLSVMRTANWRRTVVPGMGDWPMTVPGGTVAE